MRFDIKPFSTYRRDKNAICRQFYLHFDYFSISLCVCVCFYIFLEQPIKLTPNNMNFFDKQHDEWSACTINASPQAKELSRKKRYQLQQQQQQHIQKINMHQQIAILQPFTRRLAAGASRCFQQEAHTNKKQNTFRFDSFRFGF